MHSHEARVIFIRISALCQRSNWIAFISPANVAPVGAVLKHPKGDMKYIRFCRHCIAIILIPACSQNNSFGLSYRHSESKTKYTEALGELRLEGTSGGLQANRLPKADSATRSDHAVQGSFRSAVTSPHGWRLHKLPGQPV